MTDQENKLQKVDNGGPPPANIDKVENALLKGDLSKLTPQERKDYYRQVCQSTGLNPLTKPFEYIRLNGSLTLYARKTATDQLRKINGVSITDLEKETGDGLMIVTAHATDEDGRTDSDMGVVKIKGKRGDALANAMMKAVTKAKRRVTLSICGLGWLDETELDTIRSAQPVEVDHETGEIETNAQTSTQPQRQAPPPRQGRPANETREQSSGNGYDPYGLDDEIGFGKNNGKTIRWIADNDDGYLEFLLDTADMDFELTDEAENYVRGGSAEIDYSAVINELSGKIFNAGTVERATELHREAEQKAAGWKESAGNALIEQADKALDARKEAEDELKE